MGRNLCAVVESSCTYVLLAYTLGCQYNNRNVFLSNCETSEMKKAHGDMFSMPKTMLNRKNI